MMTQGKTIFVYSSVGLYVIINSELCRVWQYCVRVVFEVTIISPELPQ